MKSGLVCSVLRAALLGAASLLALAGTAGAQGRVGVTSATDGDPLGKPPTADERILKIGIDVQANEIVTTRANDRAHLVFLDGSSLTVGPNARLTIDKFVYDPNTKTGELALTTTQGVFRLVGGKISKTNPVTINTPSSTIGIRGGITIFNVSQGRTTANFIFGNNMTVSGQGQTQNVTRPGTQVVTNAGAAPSPPTLLPPGGLTAVVSQLEGGNNSSSSSGSGSGGNSSSGGGAGSGNSGSSSSGGGSADSKVGSSGLAGSNSGGGGGPPTDVGGGAPPTVSNNQTSSAVQNSGGASNPQNNTTATFTPPTTVTTQTQTGYTNGLIVGTNGGISTTRLPAIDANVPTDFSLTTTSGGGQNNTKATIVIRGLDGTLSSPNAILQLGGSTTNSTFLNDSMFTTKDVNRQGTVTVVPPTTLLHSTELTSLLANQQSATPVSPTIPQGGPDCTCAYLTFGYWTSDISYNGTYRPGQTDRITTAPFVAGNIANATMLPNTSSATYTGFMAGMAQLGTGNPYAALGTMTINYNFGRGTGAVSGTWDTMSYAGAIAVTPGTANVTGQISTTGGPSVSGPLAGSFFSGGGDPAKYIAGGFGLNGTVSGTQYKAGGIFATQRP